MNDINKHEVLTLQCRCKPELVLTNVALKLVHNAFDHREVIEQAEEIMKDGNP